MATARKPPPAAVEGVVRDWTRGAALGLLSEPRVNVLQLNLALDTLGG